jgi:hypothetical protein
MTYEDIIFQVKEHYTRLGFEYKIDSTISSEEYSAILWQLSLNRFNYESMTITIFKDDSNVVFVVRINGDVSKKIPQASKKFYLNLKSLYLLDNFYVPKMIDDEINDGTDRMRSYYKSILRNSKLDNIGL